MNSNSHKSLDSDPSQAEEALRVIANLPAPAGLEDRIHAALRAAPRTAHVLAWPTGLHVESSWMRTAAAAAIVMVVAGGGWGIYTRVQRVQPARAIVMPAHMPAAGGFSSAGAMRTPQTLPGPTVTQPAGAHRLRPKGIKKPVASPKAAGATVSQPGAAVNSAAQPTLQPPAAK